jgi:tetratricopeptide (TPR) repeat protein
MKKNDFDKAIECYEKAIELGSNDAYTNIGVAYSQKGDCGKAIEYYKKAIELNPDDADIHHNMARVYDAIGLDYSKKQDYEKALEYKNKAEELFNNTILLKNGEPFTL